MKTIFQRDYSEQEKTEFDLLLKSSISNLPFTLSSPIENFVKYVEKEDYGRAMNYAIDFFEIATQYLSCILIASIQKTEEESSITEKHKEMIRAIQKIDVKRPLSFGDWVNDIFVPLLKAATERMPDSAMVASLNKHIITKDGNLLIGGKKDPSIVQIRNEYKGHSTTLSEDIYKGVVYTLEPRIFLMLKAVTPLQEWTYFACQEQLEPTKFRINLLNGSDPNKEKILETSQLLEPFHYYICQENLESHQQKFVDVFPMIFCNEKNYEYVLQSLKDEYISYISANENAITYTDECWNEALDKCFQKTVPSFDVAKELNRDEIVTLTDKASRKFLEHAYKEKKYNRELFVDRSSLSTLFSNFRASDKNLFPLLGEAGQGKTNQLCYWTEQLIEQNTGVIIFNSSGFSESTLEEKIKDIFGFSRRKPVKKLLDNVHKKMAEQNEYVYFIFDAINECLSYKGGDNTTEGPLNLYRDIRSLLINEEYSHFKVLFTCRTYTWKNLIQPTIPKDDNFTFHAKDEEIAVRGFTNEELEKAYEVYRELYQMDTPFSALSRNKMIRLKDPLVLKIACTNYLGMELPNTSFCYTSISLFEKMLNDISRSYAGNKQCSIVKELARYILQEYEKGIPTDSISSDALRQAYFDEQSQLHAMAKLVYKKDEISVAYGELLNKPERPVLRLAEKDDGTGQLQFIYERFLEFMLATVFVERERNALSNGEKSISAETFFKTLQHSSTNVVFMGAMRNALIMDYAITRDLSVITELIEKYGNNSEVTLLVTETLNVLIRENYETEIFALIEQFLRQQPEGGETLIQNFNEVNKKIESSQADDHVISEHNRLYNLLSPIIRLRRFASASVVNGIFLTDYFNEGLYQNNPYQLLWTLMSDPIIEVRNDACMYVYLLSNKTHTLEYSLIDGNLTQRIIHEMYSYIKGNPLLKIAFAKKCRTQSIIFLETATRLCVLLIIDIMMAEEENSDRKKVEELLNEIRAVFRHLTLNYNLLKIMMPFFQLILRRQVTFTSLYVNNVIEYQTFWDEKLIPIRSENEDDWTRENFIKILGFIYHYNRYFKNKACPVNKTEIPDFTKHHKQILSAYKTGDAFSYFLLERIMVIMGTCDWEYVRPLMDALFTDEYRQNEWNDYTQMSLLYILFQVSVHNPKANEEIISLYGRESEDWTQRCRGLFKGRNSHVANPTKKYKRNVMNWYCVVYCCNSGDAVIRPGDERCVPVFYNLLDDAIKRKDKELLYHLLENISELVSDFGYIKTTLELIKYILEQFDTAEKVAEFDNQKVDRDGIYQDDLVTLIGKVLSTAKNCFPAEVDNFIRKDIVGLKFPGISKYKGDILSYTPSGETLSDLFTHRFGNFLMKSLLNEEAIEKFSHEAMSISVDSPNCFKWFDRVVRLIFRDLLRVKL